MFGYSQATFQFNSFHLYFISNWRFPMKKILSIAALSMLSLSSLLTAPAQAAATGNFDVNITLTSACLYSKTSDVSFTYTSFGAAATATPGAFTVQCTKNLSYALTLDGGTAPTYSYTDALLKLDYTLTLANTSHTGDGSAQVYSIAGNMVSGQIGECATTGGVCSNSTSGNKTRTLTITY